MFFLSSSGRSRAAFWSLALSLLLTLRTASGFVVNSNSNRQHHHHQHDDDNRRQESQSSYDSLVAFPSNRISTPWRRRSSSSSSSTALSGAAAAAATATLFGLDRTVASASLSATAKLLSSIGLGGLAAKKPNVLDAAAVSALSRLTYWVFQPAFLLCSVSQTMYRASTPGTGGLPGKFLAIMPLAAVLQIGLGALAGMVITKFAGLASDEEARDVRMCTTFGNSGPLPLLFADALFGKSAVAGEVVACVSFYLLVWSPLFWSFGRVILGTYGSGGADDDDSANGAAAAASTSAASKIVKQAKEILSPPVIGSILGVIVGSVPFLQKSMVARTGFAAPLYGALTTLGTAYLPAALLVLAGSLVGSSGGGAKGDAKQPDKNAVNGDGQSSTSVSSASPSPKAIFSIFFSRFLMAPLLSFGLLNALASLGLLGPAGTRPRAVVSFVLLMEGCMPPAQNSVIMLQLEGLKVRAKSMAKLLTLMYSFAVLPVTILLSACLSASHIMTYL